MTLRRNTIKYSLFVPKLKCKGVLRYLDSLTLIEKPQVIHNRPKKWTKIIENKEFGICDVIFGENQDFSRFYPK